MHTLLLVLLMSSALQDPDIDPELLTVAERTGFQGTARHGDVVQLLDALVARSPALTRGTMGQTHEGREIPLVIASQPPVASAQEALESGKTVVLAFANIHAGEVCGKEALPMLLREMALEPERPDIRLVLDNLVLVVAPIYNADGNERVSTTSRPHQDGPAEGQGQRRNAQGLDLNRDYIKLESPEARAMVAFLNEWDPHVVIDTHTTNGSLHRYVLTYAPPLNPSGHPAPIHYVREQMLPEVSRRLAERTGHDTFLYGNFEPDHGTWATYSSQPRFGAQYHGLRGTLSILTEAYSYASYEERVRATLEFVRECLTWVAQERGQINTMLAQVRGEAMAAAAAPEDGPWVVRDWGGSVGWSWEPEVADAILAWRDEIGLRFEIAEADEPATIRGWVEEQDEGGKARRTDEPKDYTVRHLDHFEPTLSVTRPFAYLVPARLTAVLEKLTQHGVHSQPYVSADETALGLEVYRVDAISRADEPFEGHRITTVEVTRRREERVLDGSWVLVSMAQPLGTLAAYLLEPQADDGLVAWNLFDDELTEGQDYPVLRISREVAAESLAGDPDDEHRGG